MPPKRTQLEERDQLVVQEFEHIREQLSEIKSAQVALISDVSALRNEQIAMIRGEMAKLENRVNILEYQNKTSSKWMGAVWAGVIAVAVSVASALVLKGWH